MIVSKVIAVGEVFKVYYLIFLKNKKKKKKTCFFIGLCINKRKNGYFQLTNKINREQILVNFGNNSPVIFRILNLKIYKKLNFRVSKLFFKKNKSYFDDLKNKKNIIDSSIKDIKKNYYFSAYFKINQVNKRKRKIKKLKRKYFRTLNWLNIRRKVKRNNYLLNYKFSLMNGENEDDYDNENEDDYDNENEDDYDNENEDDYDNENEDDYDIRLI